MGAIALDFAALTGATRAIGKPPEAQGDMKGFVKRSWLLIYREGGLWSADEIRTNLRINKRLQLVQTYLGEMARNGFIVHRRRRNIDGETVVEYSVDRACKVPRGVTVDEMWEVLQGRP